MSLNLDSWAVQEQAWAPQISVPAIKLAFAHLESLFTPGHKVLDIGTGLGQAAAFIADRGANAVGIDVNPSYLKYARNRYSQAHYIKASAEILPFDDASFDGVFSYSTFQYTNRDNALNECARVLNHAGKFAFVENLIGNPIAKAFRTWAQLSNHSYDPYQQPKHHLRWSERHIYERYFSNVDYQVLYLASPLLLLLRSIRHNPESINKSTWEHRLFSAINRLDTTILQIASSPKHLAWLAVICGQK